MKRAFILNDTVKENHHGCKLVMNNLILNLNSIGYEVVGTLSIGKLWWRSKTFMSYLPKIDLIIINGEGSIHHGRKIGIDLLSVVKSERNPHTKIALINTTYDSNPGNFREFLNEIDLISVREGESKKQLDEIGIESMVVPDLTFASEIPDIDRSGDRNNTEMVIGFTDSTFISDTEYLQDTFKQFHNFRFLPAVYNPYDGNLFGDFYYMRDLLSKSDMLYINKAAIKLGRFINNRKYFTNSYDEYFEKISKLDVLVAARYHSLCFAIRSLTPFVAIKSNSHKIEGMLNDIGVMENRLFSIDDIIK